MLWSPQFKKEELPNVAQSAEVFAQTHLPSFSAALLRAEISTASDKDIQLQDGTPNPRGNARFYSRDLGNESDFISPDLYEGQHVFSLGSGPDVIRPLYDFPRAGSYHLVDLVGGWGPRPAQFIGEIEARLQAIAPGAVVTRLNDGFFDEVSGIWNHERDNPKYKAMAKGEFHATPMKWIVEWDSRSMGRQEKQVYLHCLDYDNPKQVAGLLQRVPHGRLSGIIVTGTQVPGPETLPVFLAALQEHGTFLYELFRYTSAHEWEQQEVIPVIRRVCEIYEANSHTWSLKDGERMSTVFVGRKLDREPIS